MDINKNANLSMLCDYYELTMGNGYFVQGMQDRITYFDIFFRSVPDNGGFAIAAGLEQAIEYVQQLHFDEDDIAYLRSRNMFDEGFLQYLRGFRFTGDIYAIPEGIIPKAAMNLKTRRFQRQFKRFTRSIRIQDIAESEMIWKKTTISVPATSVSCISAEFFISSQR